MAHFRLRKRRKYQIRSRVMLDHIVKCVTSVTEKQINEFLDDYEKSSIRTPLLWAKTAPLEEIMVILVKLGFEVSFQMYDLRNPLKSWDFLKNTRKIFKTHNYAEYMKILREHKYFCYTGREIAKAQSYLSILGDGTLFRERTEATQLLKAASTNSAKNQKIVDDFLLNVFNTIVYARLGFNDLLIMYFIRVNDDTPVSMLHIYNNLSHAMPNHEINRRLTKMVNSGYLQKFGRKKALAYALTSKAWLYLTQLKDSYFNGIRLWQQGESTKITDAINKTNGTGEKTEDSTTAQERQQRVA